MSEWYDNQKKPNSNFRKLLQEHFEKTNPRRELTADEAKRLAKLEAIADKLRRGELKDKPSELKRYEEKLNKAQMKRNRADAYHRKGRKAAAISLDAKSESVCEDALEILHEIVTADPSLQLWFDRELDFSHGSLIDANLSSLPRLVTSRSNEKQRGDIRAMSKREVKLSIVERACQVIGREEKAAPKDTQTNLRDFLQVLK